MGGLIGYGAYIPRARLQRGAIAETLGAGGAGRGSRSVASYDEDTTSMGVEAARLALRAAPEPLVQPGIIFATADPAYLDKTNATAIHAALALDRSTSAFDMVGSVRSATGAMSAAASAGGPRLAVLSDLRTGLPGGNDEANGGDGAVAFLFGEGPPIVETLGGGHTTDEFLDRWRLPGEASSSSWEERFGETAYVPLAESAVSDALKRAGLTPDALDHVVLAGLHSRAVRGVARGLGVRPEALADDLTSVIGNTGTAHAGIVLADVLDRAGPGEVVMTVTLADGCDVWLARTTDALADHRARAASTVAGQVAAGRDISYPSFLTWRGQLRREPPRRPDPVRPAAPVSFRREEWKFAFTGSRCTACGMRHLPPQRVCAGCGAADQTTPERLADVPGTIATYTVDRLAFSLAPPVVAAVIDFDGGGRFTSELTDVDPAAVAIGGRVEMTFRRLFTAEGVHNYFWKARPLEGR